MSESVLETRLSMITRVLYVAGLLLVITTLVDYLATIWPHRPSAVEWRYGSIGLAGGFLLTPLLGMALVLLAATWGGSRPALWVVQITALGFALILVAAAGLFVLDSFQVRASVEEGMKGPFLFGIAKALFKLLTGAIALAMIGLAARNVRRALSPGSPDKKRAGTLVVGK